MSSISDVVASTKTTTSSSDAAKSSDRRQWKRILETLVGMLHKQESQLETLVDDRKFLEDYVHLQHDKWVAKNRLLQSQVSQIKREETTWKKAHEAKQDLLLALKEKEIDCYREHLDLLKSDLDDLYGCIDSLSQQNKELKKQLERDKEKTGDGGLAGENSKQTDHSTSAVDGKLRKLQQEIKILSSKKEAEISSLLAEKDFIWHQFKKIDEDYANHRKSKNIEFEQVNEAVAKLQDTVENLQATATEKDGTIANLRTTIMELELDLGRRIKEVKQSNERLASVQDDVDKLKALVDEKDDTISRLKDDINKLQAMSNQTSNGMSEKRALPRNLRSSSLSSSDKINSRRLVTRSASTLAKQHELNKSNSDRSCMSDKTNGLKGCSTSRKNPRPGTEETPKLFTGNFKVPRLKDLRSPLS